MTYEDVLLLAVEFAGRRQDVGDNDVITHLRNAHAKALRTVLGAMDEATSLRIAAATVGGVGESVIIDTDVFVDMTERWIQRNKKDRPS